MSLSSGLAKVMHSRVALPIAFFLGLLENTVFLFAMEPLFLPMMATRGRQAWRIALALVLGAVLGGTAMYALGAYYDEPVIRPLFERFGLMDTYYDAGDRLQEDAFMSMFLIAVTPFPYQFGAVAAGAAGLNLPLFLAACFLGRGARYFFYAVLIMLLGKRGERWIEGHELHIFVAGIVVFVGVAGYMLFAG